MNDFKDVSDIIKPDLNILLVGINPGIETARTGFHFAHPTNRFWSTLYRSGFTPKLLQPNQNYKLLDYDIGITNVIDRPTKSERELKKHEFKKGQKLLLEKIKIYKPKWVAFVGIGLYRKTFDKPKATVGQQEDIFNSKVWVLPQPSGLNAHYTPDRLEAVYLEFRNETLKDQAK